jgi:outer membrane protein assembly factor BamD
MYIRPMKKIRIIDFNLLFFLILCFIFSNAFAAEEVHLFQNINPSYAFEVGAASVTSAPPIDFKSKKKKNKVHKSSGKVNFESFRQYYDKAMKYYNNRAWLSAARIFEELYPLAIGTTLGDTILFLFADSYFQNRDYQMAAFHYRDYARRYPGTERTELATLNAIKAMYYNSPEYNLDQLVTTFAIDEVILFIQQYPHSKHIEECNEILDALRDKLARKEMEMVKMYYQTGYYEATQIMAKNFMKNYSASKYAPEVLYTLLKNNYDFARKSVLQKQYHRYKDCLDAYEMLQMQYPESSYIEEGKKIANDATAQINKNDEQKK